MSRARRTLKQWGYLIAISLLAGGILIEGALLVPVIRQQAQYAEQGRMARERQVKTRPVTCKEHRDAYGRGVISLSDLVETLGCAPPG